MKILITGASRGIGQAIAERAAAEGLSVHGTSRSPNSISKDSRPPGVQYHQLDLTEPRSIEDLAAAIGEVDVLINNAGLAQIGSVEETGMPQIRYLFDLNVIGAIHLTRLMLPGMRAKGRGLVINITSMADTLAVPFSSLYAATKQALAGFTKGLRNEVKAFGIRVIRVVPIYIRTDLSQQDSYQKDSPYSAMVQRVKKTRDRRLESGTDPKAVADLVCNILRSRNPKLTYHIGRGAKLFAALSRILPERWSDNLIRRGCGLGREGNV